MTDPIDEGFLARWSRRKRAVAEGERLPAESPPLAPPGDSNLVREIAPSSAAEGDVAAAAEKSGDLLGRVLTEADFADFDFAALDFKSDYTKFMQAGVPESVRNRALRQLWASDPIMANMDGLHDYWDDYTDAAVAVPQGTLKTAYRIGKGFLTDEEVATWDALGKPPEVASAEPTGAEMTAATSAATEHASPDTTEAPLAGRAAPELGADDAQAYAADASLPAAKGDDPRVDDA